MISNFPYEDNFLTPVLIFHQLKNTNSRLTMFRRASLRSIPVFREVYGLNAIITCEMDEMKYDKFENDYQIKIFKVMYDGKNSKALSSERIMLLENIKDIYKTIIRDNLTILIHCSSGTSRTSVICYCILRMNGETIESSREILLKLRSESRNGVGDFRTEYAEKYLVPYLLKSLK
jgi:hypothetical protein